MNVDKEKEKEKVSFKQSFEGQVEHGLEEPTEPPCEDVEGDEDVEVCISSVTINHKHKSHERVIYAPSRDRYRRMDVMLAFWDVANDMLRHERVVDVHAQVRPALTEVMEMMIQNGLEQPLSEEFLALCRVSDGYEFAWSWLDDAGVAHVGGGFHLHELTRVYGSWLGEIWGEWEEMTQEERDFVWELRRIDVARTPWGQEWSVVMLHRPQEDERLFLHHRTCGTIALDIPLKDYMHWALSARGIWGWQFLRSDYDFEDDPLELDGMWSFFKLMRDLFPEDDVTSFRDRLPEYKPS